MKLGHHLGDQMALTGFTMTQSNAGEPWVYTLRMVPCPLISLITLVEVLRGIGYDVASLRNNWT